MKHHKTGRTFNRERNQRKALMKALAVSLVMKEKIETSEAKAKSTRPLIEKLVSQAKKGTLAAHRGVISSLGPKAGKKLFLEIAPRYKDRSGGYTRITKLIARKGDGSPRAFIEFV